MGGLFAMASTGAVAQLDLLGGGLTVTDLTANGSMAVGDNGSELFMWTPADGVTLIGGVAPQGFGGQTSVSADGSVSGGTRINPNTSLGEMSAYDVAGQSWTSYGGLGSSSGNSASSTWGISSDGSTLVGLGWVNAGTAHGIYWNQTDGVVDLGSTVTDRSTRANACNQDGSIIGGWQDGISGFRQGAIWVDGVQQLLFHPNNDEATEVSTLSDDGQWAGGGSGFANNFQAWKWSEGTGIVDIGPAPIAGWRGSVSGLSANGYYAVGFYRPFPGPAVQGRGFIHNDDDGLEDLTDLATDLGIDVQGQVLALPLVISDDGSTIGGLTGSGQGFVLRLPIAPANDACGGAIAIQCGDSLSGSTANATDTGGNDSPDVFYSFTGAGDEETITVSLCGGGTDYNSYLRVYSDCDLADEIASNDDSCGEQSEVSFTSDGSSTYYIMVEGANSESGNYQIELSCEPVLSVNDLQRQLGIYPNPVKDQLYIESQTATVTHVEIYDLSGRRMNTWNGESTALSVDVASLQAAVYFVRVHTDQGILTKRLVKN